MIHSICITPCTSETHLKGAGSSEKSVGLFTKEQIMFRKLFPPTIRFLIGFVIWTMCVHKHCNCHPDHKQDLHTARKYFVPSALTDPLTLAWLQRAFPKCTNHVPKELCVHKSSESGFLGGSRSKMPFFFSRLKSLIWKSFAFTKGKIRLSN